MYVRGRQLPHPSPQSTLVMGDEKLDYEVEVKKKIESLNNICLFKYLSSQANPICILVFGCKW